MAGSRHGAVMILETGRIVAIEPLGLWVETIQRSACGSCSAQKGCGHSLLANMGASAARVWVLLDGRDARAFSLGGEVQIGIREEVIVRGSLLVYLLPLVSMIAATLYAQHAAMGEGDTAVTAVLGLLAGATIVRVQAYLTRFDPRLQPVLVAALQQPHPIRICK